MPGLNIVVVTDEPERFRGALMLAMAQAALGGRTRIFLQVDAVRLLRPSTTAPRDRDHAAHGLPSLAALIDEALDAGVALVACQSGMTLAGIDADDLNPRIEAGGPVSFLQSAGPDERLLSV